MVNLGSYKGLASCSCEFHSMTLIPQFKAAGQPDNEHERARYRCKHIIAAREYLTNEVIRKLRTPILPITTRSRD